MAVQRGQTLRLTIQQLCEATAHGLAPIPGTGGKAIRVAYTRPGDVVDARVLHTRGAMLDGKLVSTSSPSPPHPRCPQFSLCGGCQLQHLSYDTQLEWKQRRVTSLFAAAGVTLPSLPPVAAPSVFHYRNRCDFDVSDGQWLQYDASPLSGVQAPAADATPGRRLHVGFHPVRFGGKWHGKVVPVPRCHLQSADMNTALAAVRTAVDQQPELTARIDDVVIRCADTNADGPQLMVNFRLREWAPDGMQALCDALLHALPAHHNVASVVVTHHHTSVPRTVRRRLKEEGDGYAAAVSAYLRGHCRALHGSDTLWTTIAGAQFRLSPNAFLQTNTQGATALHGVVKAALGDGDGSGDGSDGFGDASTGRLFDLFCGSGLMSVPLASSFRAVHGWDLDPVAIEDAAANATRNGVTNASWHAVDLSSLRGALEAAGVAPPDGRDTVVVDPPRPGLHPNTVGQLAALPTLPRRIVYVSCNPVTQARDVAALLAERRLRVAFAQAVDLFPQTRHVEHVVALVPAT